MSDRKRFHLTEEKLRDLLHNIGVTIYSTTASDIIAACPFHKNLDSPAFNISLKPNHPWKCHNGKCNQNGNIVSLLTKKGYTKSEAEKMLLNNQMEIDDLVKAIQNIFDTGRPKLNDWTDVDVEKFRQDDEASGWPAKLYLESRGITESAYNFFKMGYSSKKDMVIIPVFNEFHANVGCIGRAITHKQYQYSTGLVRGNIIWNVNKSKRYDTIILTEGALDSVYIWQTGWQSVGAVLGSAISPNQWKLLRKYFTEIVCFFDNDEAGNGLRDSIIQSVQDIAVSYVTYPDRMITMPDGTERPVKDSGELTPEEICDMLDNRSTSLDLLMV